MNLVFKYNWDHRPIPLNTGQGRLQFSLPFASGIPNLAPSFSQVQGTATVEQGGTGAKTPAEARANLNAARSGANEDITELKGLTTALSVAQGGTGATTVAGARSSLGLGSAATKNVGENAGNVMEVGAFGVGMSSSLGEKNLNKLIDEGVTGLFFQASVANATVENGYPAPAVWGGLLQIASSVNGIQLLINAGSGGKRFYFRTKNSGTQNPWFSLLHSGNTSTDSNGYIKAASPICNLYVDHIELNDEAKLQEIIFEKVDVGNYLVRGSLGFAQEGWYIEMPKDANGNVLVAVKYQQLESGDIQVKTFAKKFDEETGDIVPNLLKPRDIPEGRFISLRLQGLPEPEFIDDPEIMESDLTNNATATAEDPATQSPEEQPAK